MHPFLPGYDVPGAPVSAGASTQKLSVVPHWAQTLQQTLSGQGFRVLERCHAWRGLGPRNLGAALSIGDGGRHWGRAGRETDLLIRLDGYATGPAPRVLVELADLVDCQGVFCGNIEAVIVLDDGV